MTDPTHPDITSPVLHNHVPRDKQWQVPRDRLSFLPAAFRPRAAGKVRKYHLQTSAQTSVKSICTRPQLICLSSK